MTERTRTEPVILSQRDEGPIKDGMISRLISMILIGILLSLSRTVFAVIVVVQFIIMMFNGKQPSEGLAEFGTTLAVWVAKAIRYQTAASETRPWPWTDLD